MNFPKEQNFEDVHSDIEDLIGDIDRLMMRCPLAIDEVHICGCSVCSLLKDAQRDLRKAHNAAMREVAKAKP